MSSGEQRPKDDGVYVAYIIGEPLPRVRYSRQAWDDYYARKRGEQQSSNEEVCERCWPRMKTLIERRKVQADEIDRLRAALQFYADREPAGFKTVAREALRATSAQVAIDLPAAAALKVNWMEGDE